MTVNVTKLARLGARIQRAFPRFYLAGGTAIMLRHRHRASFDLDFFSRRSFSFRAVSAKLRKNFSVEHEETHVDNIDFFVEEVKVSFVFFPFDNRKPIDNYRGLRLASDFDLCLNKLYAAGRRIEPKDIRDIAHLIRHHRWSVKTLRDAFEVKFPDQTFEIYLGAVMHFEEYGKVRAADKKILQRLLDEIG